jgi:hypothetical protein
MRKRDNRLAPSAAQRRRWAQLPGFQPHEDTVRVEHDSWSDRPAVYRHVPPDAIDALRLAAERALLTVWTVDPNEPRPGNVHLNCYTLTVAQALELIAGCAGGRWIEEVLLIEPAPAAPTDGSSSIAGTGLCDR